MPIKELSMYPAPSHYDELSFQKAFQKGYKRQKGKELFTRMASKCSWTIYALEGWEK